MSDIDGRAERALWAVAKRTSGRGVAITAGIFYFGLGLAVPLILGWSTPWLIAANVSGTMAAAVLLLIGFAVRIEARDRRQLVEWTSDLRRLDATEFEWFVGELLRREGWMVEEVGRQGGCDGEGIDRPGGQHGAIRHPALPTPHRPASPLAVAS